MFLIRLMLRLALPLVVLLLVLMGGAARIGSATPTFDYRQSIPGFRSCELPCWAGITPLQTDYTRVRETLVMGLAGMNVVARDYIGHTTFSASGAGLYELSGAVYENRGRVGDLRIDAAFPLWFLMNQLGTPVCVSTDPMSTNQATVTIYWQLDNVYVAGLVVVNRQNPWQADTATRAIYVFTANDACQRPGAYPWQGFAPLWFYGLTTALQ